MTMAVTTAAVPTVAVRTAVITRVAKTVLVLRREARIRSWQETAFQPASATRRQDPDPGHTPG